MKAVFLDRDGALIEEPTDERVDSQDKIKLFPDTIQALAELAEAGYSAILITNQAGIAEGRITPSEFHALNDKVLELIKPSGIAVLGTYFCPHSTEDVCDCRKPKPTMILQAANDHKVDMAEAYMVGDRESDVLAGANAGIKAILVQTGLRPTHSNKSKRTYTATSLVKAVDYIIAKDE